MSVPRNMTSWTSVPSQIFLAVILVTVLPGGVPRRSISGLTGSLLPSLMLELGNSPSTVGFQTVTLLQVFGCESSSTTLALTPFVLLQ